jgi:probable addiction module antidote protein
VKTTKAADLDKFDLAEHLQTAEDIAEYLRQVLEEGDAAEFADALGQIARAKGMSEIAEKTGIQREALYKALRPNSHPRLDTVQRVCNALGVKLTTVRQNSLL